MYLLKPQYIYRFPSIFSGALRTPGPMLMVDGSSDASWSKDVPFWYVDAN